MSVRAVGGAIWCVLVIGLPALAAGALAAWLLAWLEAPAWPAAAAALAAALAAARLETRREVELAWDGRRWSADGVAGSLDPMIDLGFWMLLRLTPEEHGIAARWVPLAGAGAGPPLHAFRAAVYSSRAAAARPEDRSSGIPGQPPP